MVFICSQSVYLKCLRDARMIIKKMLLGCLLASEGTPKSKSESINGALPKNEIDNYQKVLYDESPNGVWRGLIYWLAMQKTSGEENPNLMDSAPHYVVIKDG